ncbi:MAG TPA: lysophospholipid acyltransferase family protein [Dehalococcoidia bacterium]
MENSKGNWRLWSLKAGMWLGNFLPRPAAYAIARFAADLAYRFRDAARAGVQDNMRHVLGPNAPQSQVDAAAREAFRNVARYYVDLIRIPRTDLRGMIGSVVRLHGLERLQAPMAHGRGAVAATAHFGNPELAVQVGAILGINTLVLAEPLQPPAFADAMRKLRSIYGVRYEEVGFTAVAGAIRHLRAGGCLAIACDRDIQGNGELVEFFGTPARVPLGAVELAARTGAALIPCYCRRAADSGFDIIFEEELPLVSTGNAKADALVNARNLLARAETWIRADPGQWMPLERIWEPISAK